MKLASIIGFLFGTHNIANGFVTIDPCSGFTRKRYLSRRRTQSAELVQQAHPKIYIEGVVGKVVCWLFVIVGTLVGVVSLILGAPLPEMAPLMLVLLMSAVPVALSVMFTVSMAVWSKQVAKRGVLVTRLSAAEDAATMDVLCVDKTDTITTNQLAVAGVIPLGHATESEVLVAGALVSQEANHDPIDVVAVGAVAAHRPYRNRTSKGKMDYICAFDFLPGAAGGT